MIMAASSSQPGATAAAHGTQLQPTCGSVHADGHATCLQLPHTTSHWTLIHASCHEAARRADARLRVAKAEWEGAALRNSGTLTNNMLPVRSRDVHDTSGP